MTGSRRTGWYDNCSKQVLVESVQGDRDLLLAPNALTDHQLGESLPVDQLEPLMDTVGLISGPSVERAGGEEDRTLALHHGQGADELAPRQAPGRCCRPSTAWPGRRSGPAPRILADDAVPSPLFPVWSMAPPVPQPIADSSRNTTRSKWTGGSARSRSSVGLSGPGERLLGEGQGCSAGSSRETGVGGRMNRPVLGSRTVVVWRPRLRSGAF